MDIVTYDAVSGRILHCFRLVFRQAASVWIAKGLVTVLNVRPSYEFGQGHLPGAINIPLGELQERLSELDPAREVIAIAAGPIAFSPSRPWLPCARYGPRHGGWSPGRNLILRRVWTRLAD